VLKLSSATLLQVGDWHSLPRLHSLFTVPVSQEGLVLFRTGEGSYPPPPSPSYDRERGGERASTRLLPLKIEEYGSYGSSFTSSLGLAQPSWEGRDTFFYLVMVGFYYSAIANGVQCKQLLEGFSKLSRFFCFCFLGVIRALSSADLLMKGSPSTITLPLLEKGVAGGGLANPHNACSSRDAAATR
jgi:hypothetical protein